MYLFLVTLQGLNAATGMNYHSSYVVAEDAALAYKKVRKFLDEKDYGFRHDRELSRVELLADVNEYSDVQTRLFL